jgi:hypothetical protein
VLTGSVGDGPVIGANIQLRDRSGNLMAEMQSDAKAAYNITVATMSEDFPLLLEATGGTDLVTNRAPDFKLTGAAFNTGSQSVANLSPFSTFAVALTKYMSGGTTASNLENAQETVSSALNSGLDSLVATGPMSTPIDAGNIAEMVKASETLSEIVRRTRDLPTGSLMALVEAILINARQPFRRLSRPRFCSSRWLTSCMSWERTPPSR